MEMMLDKKQSQAIFLFKFKMDHKAAETTCNINNAFGPHLLGIANRQCNKSLEDEEHSGQPSEVDNHQLTAITKADPLTTTQEAAKNSMLIMVIQHLKQIGADHKSKQLSFEESPSLILRNNKLFLDWIVMCDKKWILYDNEP
ncbi:hypothetical protein FD754_007445 [Muntiacus muntjak]|uniref:Uncharacterized protein n=1 Tax=Muntiacus muntjak TaxID=9888 RepID=A0A5N3WN83_MUNMU|nr:hypothetical protein FD754_007445 [Muntiacus muntjak]